MKKNLFLSSRTIWQNANPESKAEQIASSKEKSDQKSPDDIAKDALNRGDDSINKAEKLSTEFKPAEDLQKVADDMMDKVEKTNNKINDLSNNEKGDKALALINKTPWAKELYDKMLTENKGATESKEGRKSIIETLNQSIWEKGFNIELFSKGRHPTENTKRGQELLNKVQSECKNYKEYESKFGNKLKFVLDAIAAG